MARKKKRKKRTTSTGYRRSKKTGLRWWPKMLVLRNPLRKLRK